MPIVNDEAFDTDPENSNDLIDENDLEEEPLINPEDAYYRKVTTENLDTPYHIRGDLTEDVLTEGGKALGGDASEDVIDDDFDDEGNTQPEST